MKCDDLPEKEAERKTIVFMEDHEYEVARLDKNNKWLNDKNICVLEYPDEDFPEDYPVLENPLYKKLIDKALVSSSKAGVLVQNPYDLNDYAKITDEEKSLVELLCANALQKYDIFSEFCKELGATKVVYEFAENNEETASTNVNAEAGNQVVGGGVNVALNREMKRKFKIEAKGDFPGKTPNIEAAKKVLESYNLSQDGHLQSLLKKRTGDNIITREEIVLDMTSDSMKSINVAANIRWGLFNAKGDFSRNVKEISATNIKYIVEFGKG